LISKDGLCGVIDGSGKIIIRPMFQKILSFKNGHAAIVQDGKCGFADVTGKIVVKPSFDFVTAFDQIIAVKDGKKWLFMNSDGKFLNGAKVDGVICGRSGEWFSDGLGPVIKGGLCGFVNSKGEFAISPRFVLAHSFNEGYARVWDGRMWRYIDTRGNYATSDKFGQAASFFQGKASVSLPGPLYNLIAGGRIETMNQSIKRWKDFFTGPKNWLTGNADLESTENEQ
jgi:hypothetical protein